MYQSLDAGARSLQQLWNACVHLAENLVVLRLIVLEELSSLPEGVARLAERLWLQPSFGLMIVSTTRPPFVQERLSTRQYPRCCMTVHRRGASTQEGGSCRRSCRTQRTPCSDCYRCSGSRRYTSWPVRPYVTIEKHGWVNNLHIRVLWINVVDTSHEAGHHSSEIAQQPTWHNECRNLSLKIKTNTVLCWA